LTAGLIPFPATAATEIPNHRKRVLNVMANLFVKKAGYIFIRQSILPLFVLVLFAAGCSDQRANTREPHPPDYFSEHGPEATADVNSCRACHGIAFAGNGDAVSCFDCHIEGPPFGIHPAAWTDVLVAHEQFALTLSWTSCAASSCHGGDLRGGLSGPSCFEAGCHPGTGEPASPHGLPYADAADHGPAAKPDQFYCRNCHGRPQNIFDGGFVADPAILDKPLGDCSDPACHPDARAHPTNWEGTTDDTDPTYDSSHRDITEAAEDTSCSLCHKTTGPGSGPLPGAPSCFSANFTNANGIASGCHPAGVRAPHEVPYTAAALHGPAAKNNLAYCQDCHGVPGTIDFSGGLASPGCSDDPGCHPDARAHPTNWEGGNDPTPNYRSTHRNAGNQANSCSICHNFTGPGAGPDPGAPSCFASNFTNADGSFNQCHSGGPGEGDDD